MRKKRGRSIRVYFKGKPDFRFTPDLIELIARKLYDRVKGNLPLKPSCIVSSEQISKDN